MTIRLTEKRKKILNVLKKHKGVFSAGDVHKKLSDIDLVTIYRNLNLFAKERMIKEVHLKSDEIQYEYQHEPHHHAICSDCQKVIHFKLPGDKVKKMLKLKNFEIEDVDLIVKGRCKK
jgi:Fur family peroxide stress response transcriptional regulator